jgi:hypothetical protein
MLPLLLPEAEAERDLQGNAHRYAIRGIARSETPASYSIDSGSSSVGIDCTTFRLSSSIRPSRSMTTLRRLA